MLNYKINSIVLFKIFYPNILYIVGNKINNILVKLKMYYVNNRFTCHSNYKYVPLRNYLTIIYNHN